MFCILDLGGEGFNRRLEVGIDVGRDTFCGETKEGMMEWQGLPGLCI